MRETLIASPYRQHEGSHNVSTEMPCGLRSRLRKTWRRTQFLKRGKEASPEDNDSVSLLLLLTIQLGESVQIFYFQHTALRKCTAKPLWSQQLLIKTEIERLHINYKGFTWFHLKAQSHKFLLVHFWTKCAPKRPVCNSSTCCQPPIGEMQSLQCPVKTWHTDDSF